MMGPWHGHVRDPVGPIKNLIYGPRKRRCCRPCPEMLSREVHVILELLGTTFSVVSHSKHSLECETNKEEKRSWGRTGDHVTVSWTSQLHEPHRCYKNGDRRGECKTFQPPVLIIVSQGFISLKPVLCPWGAPCLMPSISALCLYSSQGGPALVSLYLPPCGGHLCRQHSWFLSAQPKHPCCTGALGSARGEFAGSILCHQTAAHPLFLSGVSQP